MRNIWLMAPKKLGVNSTKLRSLLTYIMFIEVLNTDGNEIGQCYLFWNISMRYLNLTFETSTIEVVISTWREIQTLWWNLGNVSRNDISQGIAIVFIESSHSICNEWLLFIYLPRTSIPYCSSYDLISTLFIEQIA